MFIHTVYKPEENYKYIKDWLDHHIAIGVKHFYLYDNRNSIGSITDGYYNGDYKHDRYGNEYVDKEYAFSVDEEIVKNYPVTRIMWQTTNSNGDIVYNQQGAIKDFLSNVNNGLCAFIDMDEFIIKKEDFYPSRMSQRKFKSRIHAERVVDILDTFDINAHWWSNKVILDMSAPRPFNPDYSVHFGHLDLPYSKNYFNHYNHSNANDGHNSHDWLIKNYKIIDPSWEPKIFEDLFYQITKEEAGLMIS